MTVQLLTAWNGYPARTVLSIDPPTEAALVAKGEASFSVTTGKTFIPNVPYDVYPDSIPTEVSAAIEIKAEDFGAYADGRVSSSADATVASGGRVVTSTSIAFTSADVGRRIIVTDATNANAFGSVIVSVSGNTATCASTSTSAITNGYVVVGQDNFTAIQSALNAAAATGATVQLGAGIYVVANSAALVIPAAVTLRGRGHDYGTVNMPAARGTVIMNGFPKTAFGNYVVDLGSDSSTFVTGAPAPRLFNLAVDAANLAYAPVRTVARRSRVYFCQLWRGAGAASRLEGQNTEYRFNIAGQTNVGNVVEVRNADIKVQCNELRQHGTGHTVNILNAPNCLVQFNHMYAGFNGATTASEPGSNVYAETSDQITDNLLITGNSFDGTYGSHITIKTTRTTGSVRYGVIAITGNNFFQVNGFPDATFPVLLLDVAASSSVRALAMIGNTGLSNVAPTSAYTAIASYTGTGTVAHCSIANNTVLNCNEVFVGFTPDAGREGNVIAPGTTTNVERSSNSGTFIANGGGTSFVIAHGLSAAPTSFSVTAASTDARGSLFSVSADATNLTVTYTSATTGGVNNVSLAWSATL